MKKPTYQWKNDKEKSAFLDFVFNHVENILKCANLSHFEMREIASQKANGMYIATEYDYLQFKLGYGTEWAAKHWQAGQVHFLVSFLCHEIAHIVIEEIEYHIEAKKGQEERMWYERATEHTSRWLYRLYTGYYVKENGINMATGKSK